MTRQELLKSLNDKFGDKLFQLQLLGEANDDYFENQYITSLWKVLNNGVESGDRTGTGTIRLETGYKFVFDANNIPLLRGKYVNPWNALTEVIWILLGKTDLAWLKNNGVNYWDQWAKEDGTFGPIYGEQMRNQNGFDQLLYVINKLNSSPESRQAYISLWNGSDLESQALPPCHLTYHPLVVDGKLNLHCGQRSADSFLGVPYDYMLFYFMQQILAYWTDTEIGNIIHTCNDYHIYQNHYDAIYKYFDNYISDPDDKFIGPGFGFQQIYFKLEFPDKELYYDKTAGLTSNDLTQWLNDFYVLNKTFDSNYKDKENRYGLIKADVSV